jgi:hypothetical protein
MTYCSFFLTTRMQNSSYIEGAKASGAGLQSAPIVNHNLAPRDQRDGPAESARSWRPSFPLRLRQAALLVLRVGRLRFAGQDGGAEVEAVSRSRGATKTDCQQDVGWHEARLRADGFNQDSLFLRHWELNGSK